MARIIKSKKRRRGGAKKAAQKVKVITRNIVQKSRAAYKRAAGWKITKKDLVLSVAGAGAGAISVPVANKFLPESLPSVVKNGVFAVAGGALAYWALKKKNMLITGAGMGMAASGAASMISGFIGGSKTMAAPIADRSLMLPRPTMAAPFRDLAARPTMAAPFAEEEDFI
jgi:hypothetical protein